MISAIMEAEPFGEFLIFLQISPKAFAIPEYGASLLFKAYFPSTKQPASIPSAPFSRVLASDDFPTPLRDRKELLDRKDPEAEVSS